MNKSEIRKKILKKRKENYFKNLSINKNKFLKFLENNKLNNKIIGGYYPYNYEIDVLEILKLLKKKNYKISLPKIGNKGLILEFGVRKGETIKEISKRTKNRICHGFDSFEGLPINAEDVNKNWGKSKLITNEKYFKKKVPLGLW